MNKTAPTDIYNTHFGFSERPFTLLPDPEFLFWSRDHRLAFTMLEYGMMTRAPITVITGEVGAGKTTLLQYMLRTLGEEADIGLISNAQGGRGELLQWVLHAFSVQFDPNFSYVQLFQQLQEHMLDVYARGRRMVLIIDEAQNLTPETVEELRMLTNINSNKDELLQLVLVGQPEFRDMIRQPGLRQFLQRVGASFHLGPMSPQTVAEYVAHRLGVAGGTGAEIDPAAIPLIHEVTGGVPRLVNQICDLALVYAFSADQPAVTEQTVRSVLDDGVYLGGFASERNPTQ
ncbi:ExeA family protein [Mangrovicoccus algicola]|uniref:AAA family ATPase n=1 Tax=Mangrovicoccus algicola TaxID=2771008 RepID=A0A8J6Z8X3_9RHOB|nr:AAA family ATPase [Mangrovicoccus algicola]MBE3638051.1 AAA family ATPase [Mangrovicoccus algicola]